MEPSLCAIIQMEWLSASFTVLVYFLQQSVDLNGIRQESRLKAREPRGTFLVLCKPREPAAVGLLRTLIPTMSASSEDHIPELGSSSHHKVAVCLVLSESLYNYLLNLHQKPEN